MDENEKVVEWQDSVNIYLNEISRYPLLSEEEEKELLLSAKEGNEEARNKLVKHNLRLVVSIVNNYYTDKNDYLDLIQAGSLGLFSAIDRFDCSQNVKLATYATPCIKKYISKEILLKYATILLFKILGFSLFSDMAYMEYRNINTAT